MPRTMPEEKKKPMVPHDPNASYTIDEFCAAERFGVTFYYRMRKLGLGPVEHCPPGTKTVRISPAARDEWHRKMKVMRLEENEVRSALREKAVRAGKSSVASPKHYHGQK
jgi:hypothetical protein